MKHSIIYHFHIHGNYIAEQHIDVHDNQRVIVGNEREHSSLNDAAAQPNDAAAAPDEAAKPANDKMRQRSLFCRITEEAYEKGHAKAVEEELRRACISAPKLIAVIRTNEALGYLNTQNLSSAELHKLLDEHFHLPFQKHNFTKYRSK